MTRALALSIACASAFAAFGIISASAAAPDGAAIYKDHCARCHDAPQGRTPALDALKARSADTILLALTTGTMTMQAQMLSGEEKRAVAEYLGGKSTSAAIPSRTCTASSAGLLETMSRPRWNGWGNDASNTRFQPIPGIVPDDVPKLVLKWVFGFPGGAQAYSQPTIAAGRVFVGSDNGYVYALDAAGGCAIWSFKADAGVRTAVVVSTPGVVAGAGPRLTAFFGDTAAHVYAVDVGTGELVWKKKADEHRFARITGAPALHGNRIYVPVSSIEEAMGGRPEYVCCTFRGSVIAYDAATGEQIWKTYTVADAPREIGKTAAGIAMMRPAGAAVWSSPTIDAAKGVLYIGTGNSYTEPAVDTSDSVMALALDTGKVVWHNQVTPKDAYVIGCKPGADGCPQEVGPDFDFGNSPILKTLPGGKRIIVIGQKSGVAFGLDPDDRGKKIWEFRAGKGTALGGIEWGSAADDEYAYIPVSDVLLAPNEAGGLFALKLATGEKVWHTPAPTLDCTSGRGCSAAQSAPISVIPGVVFSGSVDGHLRAYSTKDGSIIWDYNTAKDYETVNNVKAKGGSLDAAGPAIADGLVVTNSGYALWKGMPGNVLLAFGKP
jgi:polyvinyl alcohol dehydrogenase (cytochrome)